MSNFGGPTFVSNVVSQWGVPPVLNWTEQLVLLSNDGRSSTLALPGNTMTKLNQLGSYVKPPTGRQEVYTVGIKLTRDVSVLQPSAANPKPRITLNLEGKFPKGVSDTDVTDAIYDLYTLLSQGKVHKTLFVDGVAVRP